jgi:hypothetical protein
LYSISNKNLVGISIYVHLCSMGDIPYISIIYIHIYGIIRYNIYIYIISIYSIFAIFEGFRSHIYISIIYPFLYRFIYPFNSIFISLWIMMGKSSTSRCSTREFLPQITAKIPRGSSEIPIQLLFTWWDLAREVTM